MSVPRRKLGSANRSQDSTIGLFLRERRSGLGALLVVVGAVFFGRMLWFRLEEGVQSGSSYVLEADTVQLRGVAPWVHCDLKTEALRSASLDRRLPLNDPELARRLARAFDMHPWVKRVVDVRLLHPAGATVEIVCREPVAMVRVKDGLFAVDAEGVVLPSADFSAESAAEYPRISGVQSSPQGPEGSPWGDGIVEEGATLAVAIGPEWKGLNLEECRTTNEHGTRMWELIGPEGRVILFGSAPGREVSGEPFAAVKIARLKNLAEDSSPPLRIDLSRPTPTIP